MKITAGRVDEIRQRRAEYEKKKAAYDEIRQKEDSRYEEALDAIIEPVQKYLEDELKKFDKLQFSVRVVKGWLSKGGGLRVSVDCNEYNKFDDDVALSWRYDAEVDSDGEIKRETSSWSGLSAVTEAQMDSLRQTLAALEYLNSIDWDKLINIDTPKRKDFRDLSIKEPESENWDAQIKEAELEELIGQNKAIEVKPFESSPYGGNVYVKLIAQTPTQQKVAVIGPPSWKDSNPEWWETASKNSYPQRVKKSNIMPVKPYNIIDL